MLFRMKTELNYLNTKHNMLTWQNKKIKLDKLHIFILVIFISLVIYFMVFTNPFNLDNIKEFHPVSGNTEMGGGGENPTPGSGASVLGHNPNLDLNERSNIESSSEILTKARLQDNLVAEQHSQDNLVAEQHVAQDNLVAKQHMAQDNLVAEQHMSQNQDLLASAAKTCTPDKKRKSFRRCRYADREKQGYKSYKIKKIETFKNHF